jgi:hypothetical protein
MPVKLAEIKSFRIAQEQTVLRLLQRHPDTVFGLKELADYLCLDQDPLSYTLDLLVRHGSVRCISIETGQRLYGVEPLL